MKTKQTLRLQSSTILLAEIIATKLRRIPKDRYNNKPPEFAANLLIRLRTVGEGLQFPFRTLAEARAAHVRVDAEWNQWLAAHRNPAGFWLRGESRLGKATALKTLKTIFKGKAALGTVDKKPLKT